MVLDIIMVKDIVKQAISPHLTRAMFHSVNFSSLLLQGARNDEYDDDVSASHKKATFRFCCLPKTCQRHIISTIIKPSHTRGQPIEIQHTIEISSEMYAS